MICTPKLIEWFLRHGNIELQWRNLFYATGLFLYPQKTSENRRFLKWVNANLSFSDNCFRRCNKNTVFQKGSFIQSNNKVFMFILKDNGNLELLCLGKPIWYRQFRNVKNMVFQDNGNLVLYRHDNTVAWQTYSNGSHAETFGLADIGNLVLHDKDGKLVWDSGIHGDIYFYGGRKLMF